MLREYDSAQLVAVLAAAALAIISERQDVVIWPLERF
jgi:hypothetical protein